METALFAFLNSEDYEDCIRTAIAVGGDSDMVACIAGGIAVGIAVLVVGLIAGLWGIKLRRQT